MILNKVWKLTDWMLDYSLAFSNFFKNKNACYRPSHKMSTLGAGLINAITISRLYGVSETCYWKLKAFT